LSHLRAYGLNRHNATLPDNHKKNISYIIKHLQKDGSVSTSSNPAENKSIQNFNPALLVCHRQVIERHLLTLKKPTSQ
jgi:hypothetical protein